MIDYRVVTCPHCGAKHNRTAAVSTRGEPEPELKEGAITLCFTCGEFSVFDALLDMRKPTAEELAEIESHPVTQELHEAWFAIRARRA